MAAQDIAAAMQRLESVFRRRPDAALHHDDAAAARWEGGTRVVSRHASGAEVVTDMPVEIGGSGDQVTPGWLLRAALASCAVTRIAMAAAAAGIELQKLEARAHSRSDARGLLGMSDADGMPVPAGPGDVQLLVRLHAPGVPPERLQAMVQESCRFAPVTCAMATALPVELQIEVDAR
jgi:uncharacterized OsmC-like protein